ncbi:hypothetical protein DVH07_05315 [Hafnia paralvei]|uniref:hypothetical protein n=1 Tax=Hafnia paralvei TaxID=546367 RepID=UPI000DF4830D|nr:hypothetical protein [Hafnia paralvei]RDA69858.1 hypothetical protein DU449_05315 [Hafnia paralvei]RDA70934.1 hypothetical protein DVH08_06570 [Hafnia paralvei]RDA80513.1 hypothetical protein DVH07_05315 [Hafnia paralvei]TGU79985.1 hypothetical protein DVH11_011870 [Hafnia paralvei]
MSTPCTRFEVSVPYQEGKTLEQYEIDLTAAAKERITEMYKELVCGGEMDSEIVIGIQGKCTSGYNIKVTSKNGKLEAPNRGFYVDENGMLCIKAAKMRTIDPAKPYLNDVTIHEAG